MKEGEMGGTFLEVLPLFLGCFEGGHCHDRDGEEIGSAPWK